LSVLDRTHGPIPTLKINPQTLSHISTPKLCQSADHVYHAIHHNFTTIYHYAAPQNPQKTPAKHHTHHAEKKVLQETQIPPAELPPPFRRLLHLPLNMVRSQGCTSPQLTVGPCKITTEVVHVRPLKMGDNQA
jgi:hypothetical protein